MTELGEAVNKIMKNSFPSIVNPEFTANMESLLDGVAEGTVKWKTVVENFYPDLDEAVSHAEKELEKVSIADEESDEICENCGRTMVIKYGPHGRFLACPGFPECHNTKPYFEYIKQTLMYEVPNQIERFHSPSSYSTWEWYCMAVIDNFLSERPTAIIEELGVFLSVFEEQILDFMCYPNPFSDEIHVCIGFERLVADEISIYDLFGRKVFAQSCMLSHGYNDIMLQPNLCAGVYVLKLGCQTMKIVRQ